MSLRHSREGGPLPKKKPAIVAVDDARFFCDSCEQPIINLSERYHCWDCTYDQVLSLVIQVLQGENYDWCGTCHTTKKHEHPMFLETGLTFPS